MIFEWFYDLCKQLRGDKKKKKLLSWERGNKIAPIFPGKKRDTMWDDFFMPLFGNRRDEQIPSRGGSSNRKRRFFGAKGNFPGVSYAAPYGRLIWNQSKAVERKIFEAVREWEFQKTCTPSGVGG